MRKGMIKCIPDSNSAISRLRHLAWTIIMICIFCLGSNLQAMGSLETEPNDTRDTARAISLNKTYTGNLQGSRDVDYYSFNIPTQGVSQLTFSHASVNAGVWDVEIRDANNKQITGFWSEARDTSKKSYRLRLPCGDYFIRISSSIFNKVDYSLNMGFKEENGAYEQEFNDTVESACGVGFNQLWIGNLQGYSDQDWYRFKLSSSGNLQIDFNHAATKTGNWRIQLWDDDHILTSFLSGEKDTQKKSDYLNLAAGQYYLKVFHPDPEEVPAGNASDTTTPGAQTITYSFSDIDYNFTIGFVPPWRTDPANGAKGVSINQNISITFSFFDTKIIDSSKRITITKDDGTIVNAEMVLSDQSAQIHPQQRLDYNTTYVVKLPAGLVKDHLGNITGEYQFSFTTEASPPPLIGGIEVSPGKTVNGVFKTGEEIQHYFFTTGKAGTYIIETLGNVDTKGELFNAHQSYSDDDSGSLRNFRFIRQLPANTKYGLDICSWGKSTGTYTLSVMRVEDFSGKEWPSKTDQPAQIDFTVRFSQAVEPTSLAGNIFVRNTRGQDQAVNVVIKPGSGDKEVIITHPGSGYQPGEIYWLYVGSRLKEKAGPFINKPVRMQFTIKDK